MQKQIKECEKQIQLLVEDIKAFVYIFKIYSEISENSLEDKNPLKMMEEALKVKLSPNNNSTNVYSEFQKEILATVSPQDELLKEVTKENQQGIEDDSQRGIIDKDILDSLVVRRLDIYSYTLYKRFHRFLINLHLSVIAGEYICDQSIVEKTLEVILEQLDSYSKEVMNSPLALVEVYIEPIICSMSKKHEHSFFDNYELLKTYIGIFVEQYQLLIKSESQKLENWNKDRLFIEKNLKFEQKKAIESIGAFYSEFGDNHVENFISLNIELSSIDHDYNASRETKQSLIDKKDKLSAVIKEEHRNISETNEDKTVDIHAIWCILYDKCCLLLKKYTHRYRSDIPQALYYIKDSKDKDFEAEIDAIKIKYIRDHYKAFKDFKEGKHRGTKPNINSEFKYKELFLYINSLVKDIKDRTNEEKEKSLKEIRALKERFGKKYLPKSSFFDRSGYDICLKYIDNSICLLQLSICKDRSFCDFKKTIEEQISLFKNRDNDTTAERQILNFYPYLKISIALKERLDEKDKKLESSKLSNIYMGWVKEIQKRFSDIISIAKEYSNWCEDHHFIIFQLPYEESITVAKIDGYKDPIRVFMASSFIPGLDYKGCQAKISNIRRSFNNTHNRLIMEIISNSISSLDEKVKKIESLESNISEKENNIRGRLVRIQARIENRLVKLNKELDKTIKGNQKDTEDKIKHNQRESITLLAIFTATVAFIVTSTQTVRSFTEIGQFNVTIMLCGIAILLVLFVSAVSMLVGSRSKSQQLFTYVSLGLLIILGIILLIESYKDPIVNGLGGLFTFNLLHILRLFLTFM